ncbi:PKD domain-containing protein [Pricia sp. S334]|uniref:PKD domain-containing protein n=1 Tax=Pricia mediterranea TaxID=3076079 RepID=A0ABU3L3H0_9FLAO|nr:PKD domain-containing protein [Pricia sp. S334]MDT7828295.1 PKD domain-containing protein [Pricia sp. S334]
MKTTEMNLKRMFALLILAFVVANCSDDEEPPMALADFQFLVDGTQVSFNGTVANADTVSWDFGDGNTSSEEDPVYAYASPGTFTVVMTVSGNNGTFSETKQVTIQPSLELLLTGGPAQPDGKSWRLKKTFTAGKEGAGPVDDGLGASYEDTFTFVHDGRYIVDNKDGQSLMGLVYASVVHGPNITAVSADPNNVPLANVVYTPATDATWEVLEGGFTVDAATGPVAFKDKTQLILGEYLGFKDASLVVILKEITETTMNVALGIHTEPSVFEKPTLLFHLSLEAL